MNPTVPAEIAYWNIPHDPYGYLNEENWYIRDIEDEDILQIVHKRRKLIVDLGYYSEVFKILVVRRRNWERPVEVIETDSALSLNRLLARTLVKYAKSARSH